jgi:hypothetical protein
VCVYIQTHTYTYSHTHTHAYTYTYICMYICGYIIYMHIFIHTYNGIQVRNACNQSSLTNCQTHIHILWACYMYTETLTMAQTCTNMHFAGNPSPATRCQASEPRTACGYNIRHHTRYGHFLHILTLIVCIFIAQAIRRLL